MSTDLDRQIVLVTGACGDIGSAVVSGLVARGAEVVATDLVPREQAIEVLGARPVSYLQCDMRDPDDIDDLVRAALDGRGKLDGLVVAAGVTRWSKALDIDVEDWDRVIGINLRGAFLTAQKVARTMAEAAHGGGVVLIGSWIGAAPALGLLPYCVSKAGLDMVARCLGLELGPLGIRVNVVAPGVVDAGVSAQIFREIPARRAAMAGVVPLGDLGTAGQIADAVAFLLSGAAAYVTGTTLVVDGGIRLAHAGG